MYVIVMVIVNSVGMLCVVGKLSDVDCDNVVFMLCSVEAGIDLAVLIYKTNPQAGGDKLTATITVLTALQAYLATKGTTP